MAIDPGRRYYTHQSSDEWSWNELAGALVWVQDRNDELSKKVEELEAKLSTEQMKRWSYKHG